MPDHRALEFFEDLGGLNHETLDDLSQVVGKYRVISHERWGDFFIDLKREA